MFFLVFCFLFFLQFQMIFISRILTRKKRFNNTHQTYKKILSIYIKNNTMLNATISLKYYNFTKLYYLNNTNYN